MKNTLLNEKNSGLNNDFGSYQYPKQWVAGASVNKGDYFIVNEQDVSANNRNLTAGELFIATFSGTLSNQYYPYEPYDPNDGQENTYWKYAGYNPNKQGSYLHPKQWIAGEPVNKGDYFIVNEQDVSANNGHLSISVLYIATFSGTLSNQHYPYDEQENIYWKRAGDIPEKLGSYLYPKQWIAGEPVNKGDYFIVNEQDVSNNDDRLTAGELYIATFSGTLSNQYYYPYDEQENKYWKRAGDIPEKLGSYLSPKQWIEGAQANKGDYFIVNEYNVAASDLHLTTGELYIATFSGVLSNQYYPDESQENTHWKWPKYHDIENLYLSTNAVTESSVYNNGRNQTDVTITAQFVIIVDGVNKKIELEKKFVSKRIELIDFDSEHSLSDAWKISDTPGEYFASLHQKEIKKMETPDKKISLGVKYVSCIDALKNQKIGCKITLPNGLVIINSRQSRSFQQAVTITPKEKIDYSFAANLAIKNQNLPKWKAIDQGIHWEAVENNIFPWFRHDTGMADYQVITITPMQEGFFFKRIGPKNSTPINTSTLPDGYCGHPDAILNYRNVTGGNAVAWYVQPEQNEQIGFKIFRAPNGEYDSSTFSYPGWEYKVYLGSDNNGPDRNGYIQAQPDDYQHAIVIYAVRLSIPNESILNYINWAPQTTHPIVGVWDQYGNYGKIAISIGSDTPDISV